MYLKKVYINGFKSFAEKTEIMVEKGITAIVGPNGSGKSNISDAIKWVLGEQSAKSLRGVKMDDVIFAGTVKRLPLGYAEVNLIFDNESGDIPVEYKEVSIKRKLYKTGESEYYINKQQCRLKDIREIFMDTGIGRDGYSFIGQGRVEDILSPNSETRRQVFEEACGIVKYKIRKEESERKLEKTSDNLDRADDIVHELEDRIEPLKEQSLKAKKYIETKESLKKYELNYLTREYEKHSEQCKALKNQRDTASEQKIKLQKRIDVITQSVEEQKKQINEIKETIRNLEAERDSKNKELENCSSLCKVHEEKKILYNDNAADVRNEITILEKRNSELKENAKNFTEEKEQLEDGLRKDMEKFNLMNKEIEAYKGEMDKAFKAIEEQKNNLFELHKEINRQNSEKSTIESFISNNNERIEGLSAEISSEETEKQNKLDIIKMLENEKSEINKVLSEKKKEQGNSTDSLNSAEKEKVLLTDEIADISEKLSSTKSKMKILSNMEAYYDGYYKSVKILMNNKEREPILKNSVLGTVADIIKTDKEYETAVEVALGSSIQNIIVNTENEAENIIKYLKKNKIGRITFLPINMLQERSLNRVEQEVLKDPSVVNTGDMLVKTDAKFSPVIKHLLGRIIVVDNLNNGFKISKRLRSSVKIVTLQGEVINAGGSVTGGHMVSNQNLLGRKREIEECKKFVDKSIEILEHKNNLLNEILNKIRKYNGSILEIKNEINEKTNLYSMNSSKINMLNEQAEKASSFINKYTEELEFIKKENKKHESEFQSIMAKIENLKKSIQENEQSIEQAASKNDANRNIYEEYSGKVMKQKDIAAQIMQDIKLKEEKIKNVEDELKRNDELKVLKEETLKNIGGQINNAISVIEECRKKSETFVQEIRIINERHSEKNEALEIAQNEIYDRQNKINDANKAITEFLDDENKMNVKIERENSKIEEISTKLWEDYELNYAMALKYKDESISQTKLYNEVSTLKRSVKELGSVNLNSIDEFREVMERYNFLKKQQKDLIDAKKQLNEIINELNVKMRDKFVEEFANIRVKFNEVFKMLFSGGKADVYLEDEVDALNSNIEIAVQPPGKKLSKISLLSGGEKALTAIALLFAILKTKPTPFCILDEIEAALDDANIFRFAQYLREFSKETQFIVITHRKGTMECADTLYGATMQEKGVTKLVSLKLSDALEQ